MTATTGTARPSRVWEWAGLRAGSTTMSRVAARMAAALAWAARMVERWEPKERWAVGERRVMRTATSEMATAKMSVTVSHAPASSPSEWARNPKTTSMATSARLRPSTTRRRVSRVMGTSVRASPAQLPQPGVVDAEVMGDLMHDHAPHLLHDLVLGVAHGADGTS